MSKPQFMSPTHVHAMNELLGEASSVHAACKELERHYSLCYELRDGPEGRPVYWSMIFDPDTGVRMGLDKLERADITFVGDWVQAIRASAAQRRGEQHDPGMEIQGDPSVTETVSAVFAAAKQVASIDVTFPMSVTTPDDCSSLQMGKIDDAS